VRNRALDLAPTIQEERQAGRASESLRGHCSGIGKERGIPAAARRRPNGSAGGKVSAECWRRARDPFRRTSPSAAAVPRLKGKPLKLRGFWAR